MSRSDTPIRGERRPLRLGLLCAEGELREWQERCVERLRDLEGVDLVAAILVSGVHKAPATSYLYRRWRERRARVAPYRPVDLDQVLAGMAPLRAHYEASGSGGRLVLPGDGEGTLRDRDLDVLLSLGLPPLSGPHLSVPEHGVWAIDVDTRGGAAIWGLSAVLRGESTMAARLLRLAEDPAEGSVITSGRFRTDPRSPSRSATRTLNEIATWPAQACRILQGGGSLPPINTGGGDPGDAPSPPSNARMLGLGLRVLHARLALAWRRLFRHPQWNVGVVDRPIQDFLQGVTDPAIRWFPLAGRRSFLADPFGIEEEGEDDVLCERFDYRAGKGHVCSLRTESGGFRSDPRRVLDLDVHASYPFLIRDGSDIYCTPETQEAGEVTLFEASAFPRQWRGVGPLLSKVAAVDPTVFRHDGRWWLACTDGDRFPNSRLLLFHADRLEGPWTSHARNPVKIDVRSARPGGTPFEHQGVLYRPAQDCSRTYGGRIVINRVDRLTPDEFREEPVAVVEPDPGGPYPAGRHTLSSYGDRTLIDGHRFVFVPDAFRGFLGIWARDLLGRNREATSPATAHDAAHARREATLQGD